MWSFQVVEVVPGFEVGISFLRIFPVFGVGPFSERGLDEAFCLAVGLGRVGLGAPVPDLHLLAGVAEAVRAVAAPVVGQQGAYLDAMTAEELARVFQEPHRGRGLLIRQQLGKGQPGVVVDGHMQRQHAGMLPLSAQPAIAAQRDLAEARHALDIQMHQVARRGMLVALHRRPRNQVAPAAQVRLAQQPAHRRRAGPGSPRDRIHLLIATLVTARRSPLRGDKRRQRYTERCWYF